MTSQGHYFFLFKAIVNHAHPCTFDGPIKNCASICSTWKEREKEQILPQLPYRDKISVYDKHSRAGHNIKHLDIRSQLRILNINWNYTSFWILCYVSDSIVSNTGEAGDKNAKNS